MHIFGKNKIMKIFLSILFSKGFLIGFISSLLKIMQDIRNGQFRWKIALTDSLGACIMGHTVYSWASESEVLNFWQVYLITVFMSLNVFFVLKLITNAKIAKIILETYTKIKLPKDE